MNWIRSVPVFPRIMAGFGAVLLLMALGTVLGLLGLQRLHAGATRAIDVDVKRALLAAQVRIEILTARRYEKDAFINLDVPDKHADYRRKWQANQQHLMQTLASLGSSAELDADRAAVEALKAGAGAYAAGFLGTLALLDKGLLGTAEDANREFEKHKAAVHAMESNVTTVNQRALAAAAAARPLMDSRLRDTAVMLMGSMAASLLAAAALGTSIARSIRGQIGGELDSALATTQRIAHGDLTQPIQVRRGDHDSLMARMATMQDRLSLLVCGIRGSAIQVAEGSGQIASGNEDLSRRTERQGADLQQAAASIGQLSTTVADNSARAMQAAGLASAARQAAEEGGDVVDRVVGTMERIAVGSRRIADITSLIDGIAFQTNILALNAAVEAARAGEQGRGFAVVAAEVRTLAQRCASAAREIKGLVDASSKEVDAGSASAQQAGSSIRDVVGRVRTLAGLLGQVSDATRQQALGMDRVSQVVGQLDQHTQQNASLVEQAAAAAASLNQQAATLVSAVQQFSLQDALPGG